MNIKKLFTKTKRTFSGAFSRSFRIAPKITSKDYLRAYGETTWLFACVNKIAQNVSAGDIIAEKILKNGTTKVVNNARILNLLKHPNDFQSQQEFLERVTGYLELLGTAFIYVSKDQHNVPVELLPINPIDITIVPDADDFIKGYIYSAGGDNIPLEKDDIIFINLPDYSNPYSGISPTQAAGFCIETDKYANTWNKNYFHNNASPDTVLITDEALDDSTYERLVQSWNDKYAGIDNARKTALLEKIKDIKVLNSSIRDMDFVNLKNANRDEILAVFGVPKVLLGMTENVNRATAETATIVFQENVVEPLQRKIEDKLNSQLIPMFNEDINIKFKKKRIMNEEFIVNTINNAVNYGYMTAEEAKQQICNVLGIEL